uniref:SUMO interacting motifs containing 1 n=1 Tax=Anas platyrhynchos TaxID=8839 RepID=A0A8B9T7D5_ANAPL
MLLDPDLFSLSPSSLHSSSSSCGNCGTEEETPHTSQLKELPTSPSPVPGNIATSPGKAKGPLLEEGDSALKTATQQATSTPGRTTADSRVWLNKLRYFRRSGVHHLSFHGLTRNRETLQVNGQKAELIPSRRLSMVQTTIEENFLEGTLHLLNDFVSGQHYPPKETISHLVRHILLNPHQGEVLKDTYMLLMKIQMYVFPLLHPATTSTMGWNWALLKYIMEDQKPPGRLLFLQYVVQTLEDDFQHNLRLRLLQKSIAKKVLSCNGCFSNVKEVVEWLVAAVTGIGFSQPQEAEGTHSAAARLDPTPRAVQNEGCCLLTLTLSDLGQCSCSSGCCPWQVEVDRSPNCNSYKIADLIFPFILNIPVRSQREALLNSMDSHLLRCKLLEMMFHHSCDVPTTLPLSLSKILYFLGHSSVLLQYQVSSTWQRWDEMLEYLSLLLISYQNVILDHLRSSLYERMDLIIQKAKPRLQDDDEISHLDIYLKTEDFLSRMQQLLGQPFPLQINEKVCMIQQLFLIFTAT